MTLYRIRKRHTCSVQPSGTFWSSEVLYCGHDRDEALRVYYRHEVEDDYCGPGNPATEILFETLDTDKVADADVMDTAMQVQDLEG